MEKFKKIIHYLIYTFIFLLPFQTRLIYKQGEINGSPWKYGTLSLYATEILLAIIFILGIVFFIKSFSKQKLKLSFNNYKPLLLLLIAILALVLHSFSSLNPEIAFYKLTYLTSATALGLIVISLKTDFKRMLFISFTIRNNTIRIISARDMSRKERKVYSL